MVDLSIITISHNHLSDLKTCLPSLYSLPWKISFEVILIDNACKDGTADWVCQNYPEVKLVRNDKPQGFAENINMGIKTLACGRYIMMLNPDIECLPGLLDVLVAFMDKQTDVGIAGPQLLNSDHSIQTSCRRFSTPLALFIRGLHLDGIFRNTASIRAYLMDELDHQAQDVLDVDWVTGALMIVRPEAMAQVGLMDDKRYYLYSEDQDWCCRMWHKRWRVCYVPLAQAVHLHHRAGIKRPWSKAARYQLISMIRMFHKFGWKLSREPCASKPLV